MTYDETMDSRSSSTTTRRSSSTSSGRDRMLETKNAMKAGACASIDTVGICAENSNPKHPVQSLTFWITLAALAGFIGWVLLWSLGVLLGIVGVHKVAKNSPESLKSGVESSKYIVRGASALQQGVTTTTNVMFSDEDRKSGDWNQKQLPVSIEDSAYTYGIDANGNSLNPQPSQYPANPDSE